MTEQTTSQSSEIDELSKEIVKLAVRRSRLLKNAGESGLDLGRLGMDGEEELIRAAIDYSAEIGTDGQEAIRLVRVLMDEAKRLQPKKDLPETPTAIMALAKSLESRGEKLVRLDVGETDFHPPQAAVRAATAAMRSFKTHYTSARGIPELNQAIRGFLGKKYGVEVEAGQIVATPGGRFALYAALISLLRRGGSCVVLDPSWPAYKQMIEQAGGRAVVVGTRLEEGWEPSLDEISEAIRPDAKAIILNYPSNPTGKVIGAKRFNDIVRLASERGITVISDEIYDTYSTMEVPSIMHSRTDSWLYIGSFSKSWAMTGFRLGFAVGTPKTVSDMVDFQSLTMTSLPEFLQHSAVAALEAEREVARNALEMKSRVRVACEELDKFPSLEYYRPDGGIYVFPRTRAGPIPNFARRLVEEKGVTIVPGASFGRYADFFRISLGGSQRTVREGIERIGRMLADDSRKP